MSLMTFKISLNHTENSTNKIIFLCARKKHTARLVTSTRSAVLSGGYVILSWQGGTLPLVAPEVPHPVLDRTVPHTILSRGYSMLIRGCPFLTRDWETPVPGTEVALPGTGVTHLPGTGVPLSGQTHTCENSNFPILWMQAAKT